MHRTIQRAGEIIITSPRSYHLWIALGTSTHACVNFALQHWLPFAQSSINTDPISRDHWKLPVEEVLFREALSVGKAYIASRTVL